MSDSASIFATPDPSLIPYPGARAPSLGGRTPLQSNARFTGAAYPFGPDPAGVLGPKPDVNVITSSIANILTTAKGSVPYAPNRGSQVPLLLFDQNDEITRSLVRYFAYKDLADQEPRILVEAVYTEEPDEQSIVVWIGFSIVGDPTAAVHSTPISFPQEGT